MTGEIPKTLLSEDNAAIPPTITVGSGINEPDEPSDAALFWALHGRSLKELPRTG